MSVYQWIACGERFPRLELWGEVASEVPAEGEPAHYTLVSLGKIRVRNTLGDEPASPLQALLQVELDVIPLIPGIALHGEPVTGGTPDNAVDDIALHVASLPAPRLVLHGPDFAGSRFMDLLLAFAWKLSLEQRDDGTIGYGWFMAGDWEMDTHPKNLPGPLQGEIGFEGSFGGGVPEPEMSIYIPWPLSTTGRIFLRSPRPRLGGVWEAGIASHSFSSVFTAAGAVLHNAPLGGLLDLSGLASLGQEVLDALEDALVLESGLNDNDERFFAFRLDVSRMALDASERPAEIPLASFLGQTLVLMGVGALVLEATLRDSRIDMAMRLKILAGAGFKLTGPLIATIEGAGQLLSFIPAAQNLVPALDLVFTTEQDVALDLLHVELPFAWDAVPVSHDVVRDLASFNLDILGAGLKGFRLGSIEGDAPRVQMEIVDAYTQYAQSGPVLGLVVDLSFEDIAPLRARWLYSFDLDTLSFTPGAAMDFDLGGGPARFDVFHLHVEGLNTLAVRWQGGQLLLSARDLVAYYGEVKSEDDRTSRGYEFHVSHLQIGPGGVDFEMALSGGAPKIAGIGETFKGVSGSISFRASRLVDAFIRAEGPLPYLDNATGQLSLLFGEGLALRAVAAEFQLGLHTRVAWWLALELKSLRIDIDRSGGRPRLLMMITGAVEIALPKNAPGGAFLRYVTEARLEFNDLVLTRAFHEVPPNVALVVELHKSQPRELFKLFKFDIRSVGLVPGSDPGEAALQLSGQVFFSSNDILDADIDVHALQIELPEPGSLIPRVTMEGLRVRFEVGPVYAEGFVRVWDEPDRKGFVGTGRLFVEGTFGALMTFEFVRVLRASDQRWLRVWMLYGEIENLNVPLIAPIFLRDVGIGFGWRKSLAVMDHPEILLQDPSQSVYTVAPFRPSSWVDDLEGDSARWSAVASAWVSLMVAPRSTPLPLVGDLLLAVRSDLTIMASMRGWFMRSLDGLKHGEGGGRPMVVGRLLLNPRRRHLLAAYQVDPAAAAPEGVPSSVVQAFLGDSFPFLFETRPNFFRLEVAWPRHLKIPWGIWDAKAGFMIRVESSALTIGLGFELTRGLSANYSFGLGPARLFISFEARIGIWGEVMMRLGAGPALWGAVGVYAVARLSFGFELKIKLGFVKIHIRIEFGIELIFSATLSFGISGAGVGFEGVVSVSARIWKFSFGGSLRLAVNGGAVQAARAAILGGSAGDTELLPPALMPNGDGPVPEVGPERPRWAVLAVERNGQVFAICLPKKDAVFALPVALEEPGLDQDRWQRSPEPDYGFSLDMHGVHLEEHLGNPDIGSATGWVDIEHTLDWNRVVVVDEGDGTRSEGEAQPPDDDVADTLTLGDVFHEPDWFHERVRIVEAIADDERYRPELLEDWRVRAERSPDNEDGATAGVRPDVRSPYFNRASSLYDAVLEQAGTPEDPLSWESISVGMTQWDELMMSRDAEFTRARIDEAEATGALDAQRAEALRLALDAPDTPEQVTELRRYLLGMAESWLKKRGSLAVRLLRDMRAWVRDPDNPSDLLRYCGLAMRFAVDQGHGGDWRIAVTSIRVRRPNGQGDGDARSRVQVIEGETIDNAVIQGGDKGLGFANTARTYRVRNIMEFQEASGIHLSWQLECTDAFGDSLVMKTAELAGLEPARREFEFFDHFLVERINLSRPRDQEGEASNKPQTWQVQPGFISTLADLGDGEKRFFLLAPRFDLSDKFEAPANVDVGDLLLYRITAVDTFGTQSLVTEHVTTRKHLTPPVPPKRCEVNHRMMLAADRVVEERVTLTIEPLDTADSTAASDVYYEVWARSLPLACGGYYGFSDVDDEPKFETDRSPTEPRGMSRILATTETDIELEAERIAALAYGRAYEFHVRVVNARGAVSRLIRCHHKTFVGRAGQEQEPHERLFSFLERVPPPMAAAVEWLSAVDMRAQAVRAKEPRPDEDPQGRRYITYVDADDPRQREVVLRFAHSSHVDDEGARRHPTGGYQVFVRDRDATFSDAMVEFQQLADVEVVSMERYRSTPQSTVDWPVWHGRYVGAEETPAFAVKSATGGGEDLGYLVWASGDSPALPLASGARISGLSESALLHVWLEQLIYHIQTENPDISLLFHSAPLTVEATEARSFTSLLQEHTEDKDPYGNGLLHVLGRSVDVELSRDGTPIGIDEVLGMVDAAVATMDLSADDVMVERLLHADRRTPMAFYRLSVAPRILELTSIPQGDDVDQDAMREAMEARDQERLRAFEVFVREISAIGMKPAGALEDGGQESYEGLVRRFLRQRRIRGAGTLRTTLGAAFYEASGKLQRPLESDDTIAVALYYKDSYARRYAYRICRVSRYVPLYRELGLSSNLDIPEPGENTVLYVRFPRVKPPAAPSIRFVGNFERGDIPTSEWVIEEHEEQAMVEANETLRNRLGFRGMAWSLFAEVDESWLRWSGWSGQDTWLDRAEQPEDGGPPGLTPAERATIADDAGWPDPTPALPPDAGLQGHPFTGLLLPKGTVIRVPKLPYYYGYRLGAFARADDLDSPVATVDAARVFPERMATVVAASAGWRFTGTDAGDTIELWWRVPPVWDSLDPIAQAIWQNEAPFARRLWDFDLAYSIRIRRQARLIPLLHVRLVQPAPGMSPAADMARFSVQTTGKQLFSERPGEIEFLPDIALASRFVPELSITLRVDSELAKAMRMEEFVFELEASRAYGSGEPTRTVLSRRTGIVRTGAGA